MKNYILDLVTNNIRYEKKKYFFLFLGIVLSVVLCSSVLLLVRNINNYQLRDKVKATGDYQLSFIKTNEKVIDSLKKDHKIDRNSLSVLMLELDNKVTEIKNLRVDLVHGNKEAYKNLLSKMEIKEGDLPQTSKEVIMEQWVAKRNNLKIGDQISINIDDKKLSYKLVGLYQNFESSQYNEKINIYTMLNQVNDRPWKRDKVLNIYFKLKENVSIRDNMEKYKSLDKEGFKINEAAVKLAQGEKTWGENDNIAIVLIVPIAIISIMMIINIFNIGILQRVKFFGMLKMIGLSQWDIKKIVLLEAIILGILAYPLGIGISIILVKYILPLLKLSYIVGDSIYIYKDILLVTGIISIIIVIIAAYFPARFASKLSPMEAVFNQIEDSKEEMVKKIFKNNVILDMANTNIKRNKKRYIITLLSIMVSVSLLVVYSSYYSMVKYIVGMQIKEESLISTKIFKGENTKEESFKAIHEEMENMLYIKNIYKIYNSLEGEVDFKDSMSGNVRVQIYDSRRLESINKEKYFINGHIDYNNMKSGEEVLLIHKDYKTAKDIKPGTFVKFKFKDKLYDVKVSGILNSPPYEMKNQFMNKYSKADMVLIISDEFAKKILGSNLSVEGYDIVRDEKNMDQYKNKINEIISLNPDVKWVEIDDNRNRIDDFLGQLNLLMIVFIGFILFIAFLNLFNTINTNIITRKREIGVLKAIGLSSKQVNSMIYLEGIICSLKGTIYGMVISLVFVYFIKFVQMKGSKWNIPTMVLVFPFIFSILIGYLSAKIPMRNINSNSVIGLINVEEC
ncbi:ABC transporter permease [Hathewaya histolytica]|uniref:ABC transporter permease n=1 Tax=Hathewaya histolytica TaxID=1498 RepID=UPI003B66DEAC